MGLVAHIVHGGCFGVVVEQGVGGEHLFAEARVAFDYILVHYSKYGKVPDAATIERDTKVVVPPLSDVKEPVGYYIDKVKERARDNLAKEGVKSQVRAMESGRTQEAIDAAAKLSEDLARLNLQSDPVDDWTRRTEDREAEYNKAKLIGTGLMGVETPWPGLNELTQGICEGDFWVMCGRPGEGKCVAAGTRLVDPETGIVLPVEDVVARRRRVLTFDRGDGRVRPITPVAWVSTGRKECLAVTVGIGRKLLVTSEHPLLTSRGWVRADEIAVSDKVVCAARIPEPEMPVALPDCDVDLLAILLSEGSYSGNHVGFSTSDPVFLDVARKAAEGLGMRVVYRGMYDYDFVGRMVDNGKRSIARAFLEKYGLGRRIARKKRIPDAIFSIPNQHLSRFLTVFLMADGYVSQKETGVTLASEGMIDDIQTLLLRFGVVARKRYKRSRCGGKEFDAWKLRVDSWCYPNVKGALCGMWGEKGRRLRSLEARGTNVDSVDVSDRMRSQMADASEKYRRSDGPIAERRGLFRDAGRRLGHEKAEGRDFMDRHGSGRVSRRLLAAIVEQADGLLDDLTWMTSTDIMFDDVVSIERVGEMDVYDMSVVGTHNFVAEGIVCHNTWFLVKMAMTAWAKGEIVLFISMEMNKRKIKRRMDAVHLKLNYHDLKRGKLGIGIEEEYIKALKELREKQAVNPLYVASARNVRRIRDIAVLVRLFKPKVVFLDGLYKLRPPNIGVSSYWERIQAIANDLQLLVGDIDTRMVATTQLRREGGKNMKRKRGASVEIGLEDIAFADAIGQNADVVLGLGSTRSMKDDHEQVLQVVKNREDERGAWRVKFDPGFGAFDEIEPYEPQTTPDEDSGGDDGTVEYSR